MSCVEASFKFGPLYFTVFGIIFVAQSKKIDVRADRKEFNIKRKGRAMCLL